MKQEEKDLTYLAIKTPIAKRGKRLAKKQRRSFKNYVENLILVDYQNRSK